MEYHLFYSWQSDINEDLNHKFILKALNKAKDEIKKKTGHIVYIDQATRSTSGAIDITESIIQKIRQCDIFLADVTIIGKTRITKKKLPNPNVMFELGIASEGIGWSNVILVNNTSIGKFEELPFDIRGRRGIGYNLSNSILDTKDTQKELINDFYCAIKSILPKEPKLRLKEITQSLKDSTWEAYNHTNGKIDKSECKGIVRINHYHNNIFSFEFDSYEGQNRFTNGDWKARFFVNENTLTTADLAFISGVDFGFKRIMFPLDRNYDHLYIIGQPPAYGNQVLTRK